jgi:DNA-binding PadR family transcriptional regulator
MRENKVEQTNLQLPPASVHVLLCLSDGDLHGYAIMRAIEANTQGHIRLGPGTLYGTLKRLLAVGLIEEIKPSDAGADRRRLYRLTGNGSRALVEELQWLDRLVKMPAAKRVLEGAI